MSNKEKAKSKKLEQLDAYTSDSFDKAITTNQGLKINDDNNSLKAGERGPSLLEDFMLREKITHFDHERIPERIVHARGSGAHGVFELYEDQSELTTAGLFTDTSRKTPVFVRFSTVAGSKGSPDLARDVRGFAVKFYTEEGNFDIVGNNMPIFFIQDAIKFPDLIHSVKPEPDREIPQAASAHDTFYDFVSLSPETLHNHIWAMSDRGIPRSLRMMEGFGIHSYRLINKEGKAKFVKFHWKPILGAHSITWEEAVKINGADSDFHRRDLWDAIEKGQYPEWELGFQIVPEEDEHKYDFDLLDPTKLIPEEMVPVKIVGKMTLNKNPENFFAETEQVAFCPSNIVPGIDFSNDPLLQGRLFSYLDTQISRLGGPNFHQIPINRPINETSNNQKDAMMQMDIPKGKAHYFPNSIGGGCPHQSKMAKGAFASMAKKIDAQQVRGRSESFNDFYSQPALFYRSLAKWEQDHVVNAYSFELGKCTYKHIKERILYHLQQINEDLAQKVSDNLGLEIPKEIDMPVNQAVGAEESDIKKYQPAPKKNYLEKSEALSQTHNKFDTIATRNVAVLVADGFDMDAFSEMEKTLKNKDAFITLIAPNGGIVKCSDNMEHEVDAMLSTTESVLYDALYIPGGKKSIDELMKEAKVFKFIKETFKYCKAIAVDGEADKLLEKCIDVPYKDDKAVFIDEKPEKFVDAIAKHRNWEREEVAKQIIV
ncbi:catalase [Balneicella halophila]|uniref:Catalase n=1 Tax=Balneicella halophila TaxID=1537566 RepID=A0A7L4USM7_BALHA|nr:catalase [Balneicella halophila]PVX52451.1 catalase [Balneicella halophila]